MAYIIDGKAIAQKIKDELKLQVQDLKNQGIEYTVTPANSLGARLPLEKDGEEVDPIVLL